MARQTTHVVPGETQTRAVMIYGYGAWHHPVAVRGALCPDGRRRTVRLNQQADTYFSWPGRTTIAGRSVRGFVCSDQDGDYQFEPYAAS